MELRAATPDDIPAIVALDPLARTASRADFIRGSVQSANCILAIEGAQLVGYGVLDYSFFDQGHISMLYVHPGHRRRGVATRLMRSLKAACNTAKLFTSTNQSDEPMKALLPKLGYAPGGMIENLDEGDPELIYFKRIRPQSA